MPNHATTGLSVIVLAYGPEPQLADCVRAILDSRDVALEVLLVDNGSEAVGTVPADSRVRVLSPGRNSGFAGGCNLAAEVATFATLVFVNSDVVVQPDAIGFLTSRIDEDGVGLVTGAVLLPGPDQLVNSIGNPIHYLMFSWAGDYGERFSQHRAGEAIAGISGAFFACRREHWRALGGFDEEYFAYAEDADISLRTWQMGKAVVFEPRAIGVHHYQFTKSNQKWFWLERNRLINLLTLYDARSTLLLLPVALPVEVGVLFFALRGGWAREKLESWRWLWRHRRYLRDRRRRVATSSTATTSWTSVLSGEMNIPREFGLGVPAPVSRILGRYWNVVKSHVH